VKRATAAVRACALGSCAVLSVAILAGIVPAPALAAGCPNEALRVGPSANLPDCRAYEQVSPVEKNGGLLAPFELGVGPDGTASVISEGFVSLGDLGGNRGVPGGWYSTARTGEGWVTSGMVPPASGYELSSVAGGITTWLDGSSLDGRAGMWLGRSPGESRGSADLFLARAPGPVVEDVGPIAPPGTPPSLHVNEVTNGLTANVRGVSADLSHVVFALHPDLGAGYRLWPSDETRVPEGSGGPLSLYEYVGACGTPSACEASKREPLLVGVSDGSTVVNGTTLEAGKLISTCDTWLGDAEANSGQKPVHNAMSLDGRTVFFTARACGSLPGTSPPVDELFARVGNGEPGARTVAISEPTIADCASCDVEAQALKAARFADASADGSKVFFMTSQPLLGGDSSENIYEYDFDAPAGERVVRVSSGDGTVPASPAEVQGIVRSSEDGSHVYFVANGVLTSTPNGQGQRARAGANNFYVFERDARYPNGRVAFIAALSPRDASLWTGEIAADATPDGRFLVFTSVTEHLTPDDTSSATQVFEYDAQTGTLVRVSIGQDDFHHNGNTDLTDGNEVATTIASKVFYNGVSDPATYWSGLTMSADGSYVFFQSSIGLTPQAIDHKVIGEFNGEPQYAQNIYEYHDGNVYLISDGRDLSERAVTLAGTDASGADVFFTTIDPLAPQDTDSNLDIYDARVGGGFSAPVIPAQCVADGCQGGLSAAPVLLSAGSEFQAGGNPPFASGVPSGVPVVKAKSLSRAQKLGNALRACAKQSKRKRAACRARVHRAYGASRAAAHRGKATRKRGHR
jgi:hypothetical protein